MNTYNVVISISTTVCIDAESPDDAIEKVSQALNNGDANMSRLLCLSPLTFPASTILSR